MDWIKGFTYVFEDKDWVKKMFVGALVTSVPVVEAVTNGYQMQVIENLKAGSRTPLPEWSRMDDLFGKGFKLWLAVNLFYIPSIVISFISWFLGIPMLIVMLGSFLAELATEDFFKAKAVSLIISKLAFPLIKNIVFGVGVAIGSTLLPAVFFFVPAMALRCQETGSLASTLNLAAHVRFVLRHLGDYVISRAGVLLMLLGMQLLAWLLGGLTVLVAGLGVFVGWFVLSAARFWSRLAWAYFLVGMRRDELPRSAVYSPEQNDPNAPRFAMRFKVVG